MGCHTSSTAAASAARTNTDGNNASGGAVPPASMDAANSLAAVPSTKSIITPLPALAPAPAPLTSISTDPNLTATVPATTTSSVVAAAAASGAPIVQTVPTVPAAQSTSTDAAAVYLVMVTVVQGRKIKKADLLSQSDAFVKVTCGDTMKQTQVKDNTATPQWNERFKFALKERPQRVQFDVLDKDPSSTKDIGQYTLILDDLWDKKENKWIWVQVTDSKGGFAGELQLHVDARSVHTRDGSDLQFDYTHLLAVEIKGARGLKSLDMNSKNDPWCRVTWGSREARTRVVNNTNDPVWDSNTAFWADELRHGQFKLTFDVYDHDSAEKSEIIGTCRLDGKELLAVAKTAAIKQAAEAEAKVVALANAAAEAPQTIEPATTVIATAGLEMKEEKKEQLASAPSIAAANGQQVRLWLQLEPPVVKLLDKDMTELKASVASPIINDDNTPPVVENGIGHIEVAITLSSVDQAQDIFFNRLLEDFDADGNGTLSREEVDCVLTALGVEGQHDTWFDIADQNHDGNIQRTEVMQLMKTIHWISSHTSARLNHYLTSGNHKPSEMLMEGCTREAGPSSAGIRVWHREQGIECIENIPKYINVALKSMYAHRGTRVLTTLRSSISIMNKLSVKQGLKYDDPRSVADIPPFIKLHALPVDEIEKPIGEYKCFNEFFARGLKPTARPIAEPENPRLAVCPADCRMMVFAETMDATKFWVKGDKFTVAGVFGPSLTELASRYVNGSMCIARLAPQDYHRWHLPVGGRIVNRTAIPGALYTVNPVAVNKNINVFTSNKREITELDSPVFGKVIIVAVGATMVGSINYVIDVDPGVERRKGDVHGYFAFGGSTVIILFEPGAIQFDKDLLDNSSRHIETLVKVNTSLGVATRA